MSDIVQNPRLIMQKPGFADNLRLMGVSPEDWWIVFGRYYDARHELMKLRVSLARIAQAMGLDHEIPTHGESGDDFTGLCERASNATSGWNRLAACITDKAEELCRNELQQLVQQE